MQFKQTPPHPTHDIKCEGCRHWLKSESHMATAIQNHWVPLKHLLAQGANTQSMEFRKIAPCTHGPGAWPTMDSEHWCGQYEGTDRR